MLTARSAARLALAALATAVAPQTHAALLVGVTSDNVAVSFQSANPGQLIQSKPIVGMMANENVIGIDHRPTTGALYAVGSFGNVYTLNLNTVGAATAAWQFDLNTAPTLAADGGLSGSDFGVDFNPAADFAGASSLRIVSNTNQNLAVNVDTGAVTVATDVFYPAGGNVNIVGEAYSNSVFGGIPGGVAGPPGTVQYAIDAGTDGLTIQAFNAGTLTPVGSLGVNTTAKLGFDIFTLGVGNNYGFATIDEDGNNSSDLFSIDLSTGAASNLGTIDGGLLIPHLSAPLSGFDPNQVTPEPITAGLALAGCALVLLARRPRRA